jgi:hypothetical protein
VVDIRVNTQEMTRDAVLTYVKDEALQDEQFAGNMWTRAITSSPQLTFYYLGDREVQGLYEEVRKARGEAFRIKDFLDGMMEMGPVPVAHYWEKMLGRRPPASAPASPPPHDHDHGAVLGSEAGEDGFEAAIAVEIGHP